MPLDLAGIEAIQAALLEVPAVVDTLDDAGGSGDGEVIPWMKRLETLLASKRLPVAATVASLRGVLVAAKRGRIHEDVKLLGKASRGKLVLATASLVLKRTVEAVRAELATDEARYAEAFRLAAQLVAVARSKGLTPDDGRPRLESAMSWVESASADSDLTGGFANLTAAVGRDDALALLVQCLG